MGLCKRIMEGDQATRYTVIPIEGKDNQAILERYINNREHPFKASMCRFYLRGMCIFKKEHCKYAHGMD